MAIAASSGSAEAPTIPATPPIVEQEEHRAQEHATADRQIDHAETFTCVCMVGS